MTTPPYFTRHTLDFLTELTENNDREWFAENRVRYDEDVKDPSLRFIVDFAPYLGKLSPHFMATPRSLFRIHRDTRFSKDKTPYKTHAGIHFRHESSKDAHAPGYYLHIEPGGVFAGVGIWHPGGPTLQAIREHIVEEPAAWKRASRGKGFSKTFELRGNRLKRAPRDFDPEHPLADDLKWKDYIGIRELPESFATGPNLARDLYDTFSAGTPFMRFLCDAVGVPF